MSNPFPKSNFELFLLFLLVFFGGIINIILFPLRWIMKKVRGMFANE